MRLRIGKIMNNSSKRKFLLVTITLFFVAAGCPNKGEKEKAAATDVSPDRDSVVLVMLGTDSLTVLEILKQSHSVDFKSSSMGVFVRAIDSVEQSSAAYWLYSVNGEMPKTACDKYIVSAGDTIRWHLRKTSD